MKRLVVLSIFIISYVCCNRAEEEFGGLGIEVPAGREIVTKEKPYVIVGVYEGGAGHLAGLLPGDIIEAVDGKSLINIPRDDVVNKLLRGKVGTEVVLSIKRNNKPLVIKAVRQKIVLQKE
ncbi:MAG: PDZ domain-containing protein [Spirochaetes bacterium]|nr:PDZ domain-containing protein [Spirochaetota bacterium]